MFIQMVLYPQRLITASLNMLHVATVYTAHMSGCHADMTPSNVIQRARASNGDAVMKNLHS